MGEEGLSLGGAVVWAWVVFFFSSRRRHTMLVGDWSSDVCSSDLGGSTLIKSEDWMTVWLGFLLILLVLFGLRFKTPTFRWMGDGGFQAVVAENGPAVDKLVKAAQEKN